MKRLEFIILLIMLPVLLFSQKVLTLKECYDMSASANALSGEKTAYSDISRLKDQNLAKGWLPSLDASGSIMYNSEVIDMGSSLGSLPIPGIAGAIKPLPHEQYKTVVDINQMIYDGGSIKGSRDLEKADLNINSKQTEADIYKLRSQINNCYFNIILLSKQKELLNNYLELINKKISSIQSAVNNGVLTKTDIDILSAEKINLEQQIDENKIKKDALLKILSGLIGSTIDNTTELILPEQADNLTTELARPELQLFDLKKEQLAAGLKITASKRLPKAYGFATLGYGNPPGNNFFKDEFAPYYIIGATIKWNIFDWNKTKNEKHIITLQEGILNNRKNDLTDNLNRQLESKKAEIASLEALTAKDTDLISLRKKITASSESKYDNGTITMTEYLNDLISERQSLINHEVHKISLSLSRIEFINISGNDIK